MAVSGLEQRDVPLVVSSTVWSPWGPGLIAPYPKHDYDAQWDELCGEWKPLQQKRWRSRSWGGYSTHAQLTSRGCGSESSLKKAISISIATGRGVRNLRGIKLRPSEIIAPPMEPAPSLRAAIRDGREPRPVLLGRWQSQVCFLSQRVAKGTVESQTNSPAEVVAKSALRETEKVAATTLAIHNLPYSLKRRDLLQAVDDSGFAGLYDFVNLPHKFKENRRIRNLGFAFINFVSEDVARQFTAEWQDSHRFTSGNSFKPLQITPAVVQGRKAKTKKAHSLKPDQDKSPSPRPVLPHDSAGAHGAF